MSADEAGLELLRIREVFTEYFNSGDVEGLVSFYSREAITIPPDQEAFIGIEPLRHMFRELLAIPNITVENDPFTRVDVEHDLAYTVGSYTFRYDTPAGPVAHYGRSLEVWRRQPDGEWAVVADIWHDLPDSTIPKRQDLLDSSRPSNPNGY